MTYSDQKIQCVRCASVTDRTVESRDPEDVEKWIRFNTDFRPAQALFVNCYCRRQGQLTTRNCEAIAAHLNGTAPLVDEPVQASLLE